MLCCGKNKIDPQAEMTTTINFAKHNAHSYYIVDQDNDKVVRALGKSDLLFNRSVALSNANSLDKKSEVNKWDTGCNVVENEACQQ